MDESTHDTKDTTAAPSEPSPQPATSSDTLHSTDVIELQAFLEVRLVAGWVCVSLR